MHVRALKRVINTLDSNHYYFDAACGTGRLLKEFKASFMQVIGVDFSRNMLTQASKEVIGGCFILGDISRIPLKNGVCDLSTCVITLKLISPIHNLLACVKELVRVTKRGGIIAIIENTARRHDERENRTLYTPDELIDVFSQSGSRCVYQRGVRIPWMVRTYKRIMRNLLKIIDSGQEDSRSADKIEETHKRWKRHPLFISVYQVCMRILLGFCFIVDSILAPRICEYFASEKIFVFKKEK